MNTRILRMCRRYTVKPRGCNARSARSVPALGSLQPVAFFIGIHSGIVFKCEGVLGGDPCVWKYPLPHQKAAAKKAMAELIDCKIKNIPTPAWLAWDKGKREGRYPA